MKMHENLWKSMDIYGKPWKSMENNESHQIYENLWKSIKSHNRNTWKSIKIYKNLWKSYKSMKIDGKQWKSSDDKKPAWNRAKVFIRPAGRSLRRARHPYPEIMKMHENAWKSVKINGHLWKTMKIDGKQWKSSDLWKSMKIYKKPQPKYMKIH